MFKHLLTARSPLTYINLENIAKKTKFIQRNSKKFSANGFITAMMKCVINGKGSYGKIANNLQSSEFKSISRQGVFKRISEKSVQFLQQTAYAVLALQAKPVEKICVKFGIRRILTEDSTFQKMNPSNAGNYPAHGNGKTVTAGFKMDFIYDLLTGLPLFQEVFRGTDQDKKIGKIILNFVKRNDLVLRDMGYFSIEVFKQIANLKAFWLSRLPANVLVEMHDGEALEKRLKSNKCDRIDERVYVGNERMECRLVAVRADGKLAAERRRQRRKKSKNKPSKQALIRDGWHIMLTNLGDEVVLEELFEMYRLRWNIEVRFKAWKQAINMNQLFKRVSSYEHYESLIYAALIFQLITLHVAAQLKIGKRALSLENFSHCVAAHILNLHKDIAALLEFDRRHILIEKRKRLTLMDLLVTT